MTDEELDKAPIKDCPFCGGKGEWFEGTTKGSYLGRDDGHAFWAVRCKDCHISTLTAINPKERRAILYLWNRRVRPL